MKLDPTKLDREKRIKILEKASEKIGKTELAKKIGVNVSTLYRYLKNEINNIPIDIVEKASEVLSIEELNDILYGLQVSDVNENVAISVIVKMKNDPDFRAFFLSLMKQFLGEYINDASTSYVVTKEDVEKFLNYLKITKSYSTFSKYRNYFVKILADLNYALTAEKLHDYILRETSISPGRAYQLSKVLKLFIKEIVMPKNRSLARDLYDSFKVIKTEKNYSPTQLSVDKLKAIFNKIEHEGAKAYFLILSETGLRTGEVFNLKIDQVDLANRIIKLGKVSKTKRAYITFIHVETAEYLKSHYLPYRENFVKTNEKVIINSPILKNLDNWKARLFPFAIFDMRNAIKDASRKVLGREFRLYDLRSFFASYMLKQGVSPLIVNLLQGRSSPSQFEILEKHYFVLSIEELREIYDKHAPKLLD
jgi:integrase/DNA-binding Xre family transcriptional regulator